MEGYFLKTKGKTFIYAQTGMNTEINFCSKRKAVQKAFGKENLNQKTSGIIGWTVMSLNLKQFNYNVVWKKKSRKSLSEMFRQVCLRFLLDK